MVFLILKKNVKPYYSIFFVALVFFVFPSQWWFTDSLSYAKSVKYGLNIFHSHHLLYVPIGMLFDRFFGVFGSADTLLHLKTMNSTFGLATLGLTLRFLQKKQVEHAPLFVLMMAFSFGFWRFAIEAETYIIPIFFSLWGTFYVLEKQKTGMAGLLLAFAVLIHQIHFFWWLVMLVFVVVKPTFVLTEKIKFSASALLLPAAYLLVFFLYHKQTFSLDNLRQFLFHAYVHEGAATQLQWRSFLLAGINFFRSFFQVHGYLLAFYQKYWLLFGFLMLLAAFVLFRLIKERKYSIRISLKNNVLLVVSAVQFGFALFSEGNAEFMVMLPILGITWLALNHRFSKQLLRAVFLLLFSWNFSAYVLVQQLKKIDNKDIVKFIAQNPDTPFLLEEYRLWQNAYYYTYGQPATHIFPNSIAVNYLIDSVLISKKTSFFLQESNAVFSRKSFYKKQYYMPDSIVFEKIKTTTFFFNDEKWNMALYLKRK